MKKLLILLSLIIIPVYSSFAGTITFKDGTRISEVEIILIKEGKIVIKKDKKERLFDLNQIESYYQTDLDTSNGLPGDFADYKVIIDNIKMPDFGKNTKGKRKCTISYSIIKTDPTKNKIKAPYFYLFVLSSPSDGEGERKISLYAYPEKAKIKGNYDEAAILKKINGFDRDIINYHEFKEKVPKNFGDREIIFELDEIDKRKIIAYKLEVWGNNNKIFEKYWTSPDHKVAEKWWLKAE